MRNIKEAIIVTMIFFIFIFSGLSYLAQYLMGVGNIPVGLPKIYLTLNFETGKIENFYPGAFIIDILVALFISFILFLTFKAVSSLTKNTK